MPAPDNKNQFNTARINPEMLPPNSAYVEPRGETPQISAADQAKFTEAAAAQLKRSGGTLSNTGF